MALIIKDRVKETTTTTGTGTVTLAGASTGFRSFADIGTGNTTYYTIVGGSEWEVGIGTYTASGTTLSRDTVLSNSLGTTAKIAFSAGSKDVFVTYPSGKAILGTNSSVTSTGTGDVVLSDAPSLTGAVTIGGTTDTATLTLGRSTAAQTVNIATGTTAAATTKAINIGNAGNATSTTNIAIGSATGTSTTTHNGINKYPTLTASQAVFTNASKNLVSVATTGTGSVVLSDSPTFTSNIVVNEIKIGKNSAVDSTIVGNTRAIPYNGNPSTTVVGYQALQYDSSYNGGNTVVGAYAFSNNTQGIDGDGYNTIIGANCLTNSLYSDFTVAVGANITANSSSLLQSNCVYVGQGITANGEGNEIVIGSNQTGRGNNTTLIGNSQSVTYLSLVVIGEGFTVATLPSTSATGQVIGARCFVTNALTPVFGSTVAGGGSAKVPVYYDGTSWKVG